MRDYNFYLDAAKVQQGFKYDNQIDQALRFKASMACRLRKGTAHLSEEKMIELAELAGIDDVTALMDLVVMRSSGPAKKTWEKALHQIQSTASAIILGLVTLTASSPPALAASDVLSKGADFIYYGKYRSRILNALRRFSLGSFFKLLRSHLHLTPQP